MQTDETQNAGLAPAAPVHAAPEPTTVMPDGLEFEDAGEITTWIPILLPDQSEKGQPGFDMLVYIPSAPEYADFVKKFDHLRRKVAGTGRAAEMQLDQIDAQFESEYCAMIGRGWRGATIRNLETCWSGRELFKKGQKYDQLVASKSLVAFTPEFFLKVHHNGWPQLIRNKLFTAITEANQAELARRGEAKK